MTEPNQTGSLGVTGKTASTPETPPQTNEGWQGIESAPRELDSAAFRAKLVKIMPGYKWTVHRAGKQAKKLTATGTQSSGFNRLSTLEVTLTTRYGVDWYIAKSAGFGLRAPWLHENGDVTLAKALRGLQDYYEYEAARFDGHARALKNARIAPPTPEPRA